MLLSHPKFEQICENGRVHQAPPPCYLFFPLLDEKALNTTYLLTQPIIIYLPNTTSKHTDLCSSDLLEVLPYFITDLLTLGLLL